MMKRLRVHWQAGLLICSILGVGGTGALGYTDLLDQVSANTDYRLIQEFERLSIIRGRRALTQVEWLKWCNAGRLLRVFIECPARRLQ